MIGQSSILGKVWANIKFILLAVLAVFIAVLTLGNMDEIKRRLGLVPEPRAPEPGEPPEPEPAEAPTDYVEKNDEEVKDASKGTDVQPTDDLVSDINSEYD